MKIAIQGELGSFSHAAATQMANRRGLKIVSCSASRDVFRKLATGAAHAAVIPIENSLAGPVAEHLDLLLQNEAFIQKEGRLRIEHNLIAAPGVRLSAIRRVLSHPVALDQCRDFFHRHRRIEAVSFYDTAGSVKHVVEKKLTDAAAIAGRQAAVEYGGKILQSGLEDNKQNFTRFFLLTRAHRVLPGANKTSIAFTLKNIPGALFRALSVFALRDISLSKIESRPVRGKPWEYVFYVDLLSGQTVAARKALDHLKEISDFVKVLGIYPSV
jgi:prephenate dehydratase